MKEQLIATKKGQLLELLENSRNYTIAVASAMPEEQYSFKPVDTIWDFRELMNHIGYGIHWWEDNFVKAKKTEWAPPAPINAKDKIIVYIDKAYDSLRDTISKKNGDDAVMGFHATLDHITHHRGQAVVYLRCKGVKPPDYAY